MARTDRDTLVAFFDSTGGENWTRKDNWGSHADLSQWHGVQVDEQGQVVVLDLRENRLQGIYRDALY